MLLQSSICLTSISNNISEVKNPKFTWLFHVINHFSIWFAGSLGATFLRQGSTEFSCWKPCGKASPKSTAHRICTSHAIHLGYVRNYSHYSQKCIYAYVNRYTHRSLYLSNSKINANQKVMIANQDHQSG